MLIRTSVEAARGCGRRKPGGLYLVSGALSEPCPRLPLELDRCPHCGQGIGPARGWTWITPAVIVPAERHGSDKHDMVCPLAPSLGGPHRTGDRAGLIWIGEKYYPTPDDFMREAAKMGVSRRITAVPHGFEIGRDWVYLAHRKAVDHAQFLDPAGEVPSAPDGGSVTVQPSQNEATLFWFGEERYVPGVITLFKPTAIEYVVKGDETDEEIARLEERGIQPVKVVADTEQLTVDLEDEE